MLTKKTLILLLVLLVGIMINHDARAASSVLDQSAVSLKKTSGWAIGNQNNWMAQTFTAGNTGLLTQVGVEVYQSSFLNENLYLQLFATKEGIPVWDVLYETVIPASEIPVLTSAGQTVSITYVDVTNANFYVTASQVYAIGLYRIASQPGMPPWMIWVDAPYAAGNMYKNIDNVPRNSLGFQTFVAIPEPGSLCLLSVGCVMLLRKRVLKYFQD